MVEITVERTDLRCTAGCSQQGIYTAGNTGIVQQVLSFV